MYLCAIIEGIFCYYHVWGKSGPSLEAIYEGIIGIYRSYKDLYESYLISALAVVDMAGCKLKAVFVHQAESNRTI